VQFSVQVLDLQGSDVLKMPKLVQKAQKAQKWCSFGFRLLAHELHEWHEFPPSVRYGATSSGFSKRAAVILETQKETDFG